MSIFVKKEFQMHSGGMAHYKIECDALTDEDIETLAWLIAQKGKFRLVHGVPTGGQRLADALQKYKSPEGVRLIVDDVLTTGASMEAAKAALGWTDAIGVVLFARNQCANWIRPVFEMTFFGSEDVFTNE